EPNQLDISIDGKQVKKFIVGGQDKGTPPPLTYSTTGGGDRRWQEYVATGDHSLIVRVPVKGGRHRVSALFVEKLWEPDGANRRRRNARADYYPPSGANDIDPLIIEPEVHRITIGGPYTVASIGQSPSRQKIFLCRPLHAADEARCANTVLATLA